MVLFETKRLIVRNLTADDKDLFFELLSDPEIIEPIPQPLYTEEVMLEKFNQNLNLCGVYEHDRTVCGVFEKENNDMIGLALFLTNDCKDKELGYRFRKKYWGKGYGTETTKAMIAYYFEVLKVEKVTADVTIANHGSVKILHKLMVPVCEFYNERDQCMDRRYELTKVKWLKQNTIY